MPKAELVDHADLLRDIIGNPFRSSLNLTASCLTSFVMQLAQEIYEHRSFERTPELAHALEAAHCTDFEVLGHLRWPGPHTRGCWALDLLLDKK